MAKSSIASATSISDAIAMFKKNAEKKDDLREFYYSNNRAQWKKREMLFNKKYRDKTCSAERKQARVSGKRLLMLIGDRGFGYGSRIKGHLRYGGKWKQKLHARYTSVAITNENKTSQTCVYCFWPITHPKQRIEKGGKTVLKECIGAMRCINPNCISVQKGRATQSRDKVSSMAIGISGLSTLLFQETLPIFSTNNISQFNTDYKAKSKTPALSKPSVGRAGS